MFYKYMKMKLIDAMKFLSFQIYQSSLYFKCKNYLEIYSSCQNRRPQFT